MLESNGGIKITFLKEGVEQARKVPITPEMYLDGRLFASQKWAKTGDVEKAVALMKGKIPDYRRPDESVAYSFLNQEGQECILVGNGHHRTAIGIVEGRPYEITIGGELGVLPNELLYNPHLAMQKLAVLGVEGVFPFREFMQEFVKKKTDLYGK